MKPQSAFAYVNGQIYFDNSSSNPYDSSTRMRTPRSGSTTRSRRPPRSSSPNWVYTNIEWYLQDNWKTTDRLTLDYGVRFYYLTPQWDTSEKAANFRPENFSASQAVRLFQPAVVNGARVGYDAKTGQTVDAAFIGRVVPGSGDQFQGTFQGGTLTDGNKFKVSPRLGFAYDITGKQSLVARGGFGIFYDRVQGNMVFDMAMNPPAMRQPTLQWLLASQVTPGASTGFDPTVGLSPTEYAWSVPTVYQWNLGVQWKMPAAFVLDVSYVGSDSKNLLQGRQLNAVPYGTAYQARVPGSDQGPDLYGLLGAQLDTGRQRPARRFHASVPGLRRHPDVRIRLLRRLQGPADDRQPPVRQGADVQRQLHAQPGERHPEPGLRQYPDRRKGP